MAVSQRSYEHAVLENPNGRWELHHGKLREKPSMSWEHGEAMFRLGHLLALQLDRRQFRVRVNHGQVRRSAESYYVTDVLVAPTSIGASLRGRPLEVFAEPLPLVVEVWSPATGAYDIDQKIPEYQARGDQEIWRLHPYDRTLTVWRRRSDGTYEEQRYDHGVVEIRSLPGVRIELGALFEE